VLADESGIKLGGVVYLMLGFPPGGPVRPRRSQIRALASRWQKACRRVREIYAEAGATGELADGLPGWLIEFGIRRISKATHLGRAKYDATERAKIWMADFSTQFDKVIDREGPTVEIDAEEEGG